MSTKRNSHAYTIKRDALRRKAEKLGLDCHLCQGAKGPIRFDLEYNHPLAFSADHLDAVATGGRMLGQLAPAH